MKTRLVFVCVAGALSWGGCDDDASVDDAGSDTWDSGMVPLDAPTTSDTGVVEDANAPVDANVASDGALVDAAPSDAGLADGSVVDANVTDSAVITDADVTDAGLTALDVARADYVTACQAECSLWPLCSDTAAEDCFPSCDAQSMDFVDYVTDGATEEQSIACANAKATLHWCIAGGTCDDFLEYYTHVGDDPYPCMDESAAVTTACTF